VIIHSLNDSALVVSDLLIDEFYLCLHARHLRPDFVELVKYPTPTAFCVRPTSFVLLGTLHLLLFLSEQLL
jgi:hypothetical protein